jgi:hypothetical protein
MRHVSIANSSHFAKRIADHETPAARPRHQVHASISVDLQQILLRKLPFDFPRRGHRLLELVTVMLKISSKGENLVVG